MRRINSGIGGLCRKRNSPDDACLNQPETYTSEACGIHFVPAARDDQQGKVAGAFIAEHFKDANIAIVNDKTLYGQGLADETKKALNAEGITEALNEGVHTGEKDFSALISKVKEARFTVFYWGGVHTEAGLIMRQLADQGLKVQFISGAAIVSNELASIAGDTVIGTLNTFGPDPRNNPANKDLIDKFRAEGFEPEAFTLYSYGAVQAIAVAANAAGSNDPEMVASALKERGSFKTVLGDLAFDEKGDPKFPGYVMYEWTKGPDGKITHFQQ